jgi:hypothetical protein
MCNNTHFMWCFTYILYLNFIASIIIYHSGLNFSYLHFIISTVVYIYDQSNLCLKHNPIVKHQSPDSYLLCFSSSFVGVSCEALSSLCIMTVGRHVTSLWHITKIPSQPVYALAQCRMLSQKVANIYLVWPDQVPEPTTYDTRGEHANNYTTDVAH